MVILGSASVEVGTVRAIVEDQGMCLLSGTTTDLRRLAVELGQPVPARRGGSLVDQLVPKTRAEAIERSLSAAYGLGAFPFHTDAAHHPSPPRFVLLRCSGAGGSPTLLVDSARWDFSRATTRRLRREQWVVRGGPGRTFYAPVLTGPPTRPEVRWDPGCMSVPAATASRGGGELENAIKSSTEIAVHWTRDRILVVDNWRMIHSRPATTEEDSSRQLERIMINAG